ALGVFNNTVVLQSEAEHDFTSVCEAAYSGRSKFAILPLYNTSNGLMVSLYRSLQKYDLKICLGTSVIMDDDVSESYFFLLSHEKHFFRYADHILLDVTRTADGSIHKLLYILSEFGVKVKSFNSLPLEYTDERCENIIFLDCSKTDMNALMCYISSALSDANIIGIFPFVN
ncbi:MAG: hypothetical protein IJ499_02275, partial [Clostridia bacterium]|nr:hypothetical protein [Clostridia bacterium]